MHKCCLERKIEQSGVCVVAFLRDSSNRVNSANKIKQAKEYFKGASNEIIKLAETEALQYLLENVDGRTIPLITTSLMKQQYKMLNKLGVPHERNVFK